MKKLLTIFTPTYNRGYTLVNLYKSLLNQSNNEFVWLIVDDGSSDNTEELVMGWINEKKLDILYIKQENQGKHIAHNTGVENCKTELFFCVDSDDYLLENAINNILNEFKFISDQYVCGIVSVKMDKYNNIIGTGLPLKVDYSSLSDLYEIYNVRGDTSLVFKTSILKKYKFPKIEGEKFIGEEYIYCQIDENYKLYVSGSKYYVCEYLEDGYTNGIFKLIKNNPKGYMVLKKTKLKVSKNLKAKYKSAALYIVGCWLSREKDIVRKSPRKFITIMSYPLAFIVYIIRFKKIRQEV